jgi:hypothetical protein
MSVEAVRKWQLRSPSAAAAITWNSYRSDRWRRHYSEGSVRHADCAT